MPKPLDIIADYYFETSEITRAFIFPGYIKVNREEYLAALDAGDHVLAHRHVLTFSLQNRITEWLAGRRNVTSGD